MNRRTSAFTLASTLLVVLVATSVPALGQDASFDDVPEDHTFFSDVGWLADEGITRGCNPPDNSLYCPDDEVTRGQMAAFLRRALNLVAMAPDPFTDDDGNTFESDINAIAAAGVTKGCSPPTNTRYCPDDNVTRGEMAAFLVRALELSVSGPGFNDTEGHLFENDVSRLARAGITRGCNPPDNTLFCPDEPVTRGQMAAFLRRAPGKKVDPGSEPVWFTPNMGSDDYTDLFTWPGAWPTAASEVDVFKFYTQNLLDSPCGICGDNTLPSLLAVDAFRQLVKMNIATAIEVGAVKEWGCTGEREAEVALDVVDNVESRGGRVGLLAMDEPLLGGQLKVGDVTCSHSMEESAAATATFLRRVEAARPNLMIGDIEPYPHYSVAQLKGWIEELDTNGVHPAFLHLDVDMDRVDSEGADVANDLIALESFLEGRDIPFGVIFTSRPSEADTDQIYYQSTLEWTEDVKDAIGRPQHVILQSWKGPDDDGVHRIPSNLPEEGADVHSHTHLILESLAILDG